MALTLNTSGTQSATINTEHTLATITAVGVFALVVDIAALQGGATPDEVTLRAKSKCLSGGTSRQAYEATFVGAAVLGDTIVFSIPIPSDIEVVFTLKQTAGTGRSFPWKVLAM